MKAMLIERYKDMEFIKLRNEILKMFKILKESHSDDDIERMIFYELFVRAFGSKDGQEIVESLSQSQQI